MSNSIGAIYISDCGQYFESYFSTYRSQRPYDLVDGDTIMINKRKHPHWPKAVKLYNIQSIDVSDAGENDEY